MEDDWQASSNLDHGSGTDRGERQGGRLPSREVLERVYKEKYVKETEKDFRLLQQSIQKSFIHYLKLDVSNCECYYPEGGWSWGTKPWLDNPNNIKVIDGRDIQADEMCECGNCIRQRYKYHFWGKTIDIDEFRYKILTVKPEKKEDGWYWKLLIYNPNVVHNHFLDMFYSDRICSEEKKIVKKFNM